MLKDDIEHIARLDESHKKEDLDLDHIFGLDK